MMDSISSMCNLSPRSDRILRFTLRYFAFTGLCLIASMICFQRVDAQQTSTIDQKLLTKLLAELPAVHEAYMKQSEGLQETATLKTYDGLDSSNAPGKVIGYQNSRQNGMMLFEKSYQKSDDPLETRDRREIICMNTQYQFSVSNPKSTFLMTGFKPTVRVEDLSGSVFHTYSYGELRFLLDAAKNTSNCSLTSLATDAKTKLIVAEMTRKNPSNKKLSKWKFVVDPSQSWRIHQFVTENDLEVMDRSMEYGTVINGLSYPVTITEKLIPKPTKSAPQTSVAKASPKGPRLFQTDVQVTKSDVPVENFYLSHYGIPEPVDMTVPQHRTSSLKWFMLAAALSTALAILFAFLRRRAHRQNSSA